jgi:CheY-like chemotaxis protein
MPRVMLAEDDATMLSLLTTLLEMEGYQVVTLLDKKGDPLEIIKHEKPDILLMDIFMGDQDGVDILHQIRKTHDLKKMKVFMTSGIDRTEECRAAGANGFLIKPFMPDDLIRMLRS